MSPEEALIVSDIREQFRSMYAAELPVVYGFLFVRVAGNKPLAEDLTAETFTAAMGEYRAGRPEIVTESWLRTVAKRRLIDHWRHQRVVDANVIDVAGQDRPQPIGVGDKELIVEALAKLSEDEQRALVLQHVEGYSVTEVAGILGRTPKGTESLLSRARAAFRAAYAEADHG